MYNQTIQNKPSNPILIVGMLLAFLIPICLSIIMGYFNISFFDKLFYSRFIYWGTVLFLVFYTNKVECQPLLFWKENETGIGFILLSVVMLYILYIVAAIVSFIPAMLGLRDNIEVITMMTKVINGHPLFIFFISITAAVTEELTFRGYLLTRLSKYFKDPHIPVIVSSVLFSAMHYKYHSWGQLIFTFLLGVIFSIYYIKYRNIHALILTHFLIDFIALTLSQHFY
jgi:uncharacterized protein